MKGLGIKLFTTLATTTVLMGCWVTKPSPVNQDFIDKETCISKWGAPEYTPAYTLCRDHLRQQREQAAAPSSLPPLPPLPPPAPH